MFVFDNFVQLETFAEEYRCPTYIEFELECFIVKLRLSHRPSVSLQENLQIVRSKIFVIFPSLLVTVVEELVRFCESAKAQGTYVIETSLPNYFP